MNLAILLTASRVFLAPVFAYFFITGYSNNSLTAIWISIGIAALIELSDLFDGRVARKQGKVTDFGKVFDPISDSVSRQTVFISFMVTGIIPLWMYLIFFYRDAFMQLLRIVCASTGMVLAARKSGKLKAVFQGVSSFIVLLIVLLKLYNVTLIPESIGGFHPGYWVVLFAAIFTALSVIDYIIPNYDRLVIMMTPKGTKGV